ncbi:Uncharacterised protein [Mycobacteroides abscessus subsp. abscessus]|nr:Uncharacterised protein [Mycobacteroides abscessus subsp. abscessus]
MVISGTIAVTSERYTANSTSVIRTIETAVITNSEESIALNMSANVGEGPVR